MIEFYFPTSSGEWAAFGSACVTVLLGFARLVYLAGFRAAGPSMAAQAQSAGFMIGTAGTCLLMAQPLLYLGLGAAWSLVTLLLLCGMVRHRRAVSGARSSVLVQTAAAMVLGVLPLAYVFGFL